jgi:type II restriction/modification system DNA methylase subunit YeeA
VTPDEFIRKWKAVELKERSAAQSHFIDLCRMMDEPAPTDVDPTGDWYAFERGATKTTGGEGWADVWKRDHFGWEYKGKRKDLKAAFVQLQQYALALENPPLLIVCDMDRFEIHTNWTNSVSVVHEFGLDDLRDANVRQKLKWAFSDPERLKPGKTRQALTEDAAAEFAKLAQRLRDRGHAAESVAHFINRLVFCMFAEDVDLLPNKMFKRMLEHASSRAEEFQSLACDLFKAMQSGGRIGFEQVAWFNGGLFNDDRALPLDHDDIALTLVAAKLDWAEIDPSILGTLFERGLDPDKRSQLGAHYTDRDKIMMIVNPVIVQPWLAEWQLVKQKIAEAMAAASEAQQRLPQRQSDARKVFAAARRAEEAAKKSANNLLINFLDRLKHFRVLDPACGSGNFLYLALLALKDIEHRVNIEAELLGLTRQAPGVGPEAVLGIEINPYAAELARVSVWIGELQWMRRNGFGVSDRPILKSLDNIECRDAVLDVRGDETAWPEADVIIGNPPFLGDRKLVPVLGLEYSTALRDAYKNRVPGGADLVCYWFEKARAKMADGRLARAGLVATNSIRGGLNRSVLDHIHKDLQIFEAWSDEPWVVDGAAVRVSIVCFSRSGSSPRFTLDGKGVTAINADLSSDVTDVTKTAKLFENGGVAFQGTISYGPFEISGDAARALLRMPLNPNGRSNADVVRRWTNGQDITKRPQDFWIIFFPDGTTENQAALYEAPFRIIETTVKPYRATKNNLELNKHWWRLWRSRPDLLSALKNVRRQIVTPRVSKHRLFVWRDLGVVADSATVSIARDDDTTFGILHSKFHESWSLKLCTWLGVGNDPRYTPSSTFETFPFPEGLTPNIPARDFATDPRSIKIDNSARRLDELREAWLNPPDLIQKIPEALPGYPDRVIPIDDRAAALLKKRTLTNLYNERPAWLVNAHADLDAAVTTAYGWPVDISEDDAIARLFELNQSRAAASTSNV